jgi:hypothetical protein
MFTGKQPICSLASNPYVHWQASRAHWLMLRLFLDAVKRCSNDGSILSQFTKSLLLLNPFNTLQHHQCTTTTIFRGLVFEQKDSNLFLFELVISKSLLNCQTKSSTWKRRSVSRATIQRSHLLALLHNVGKESAFCSQLSPAERSERQD